MWASISPSPPAGVLNKNTGNSGHYPLFIRIDWQHTLAKDLNNSLPPPATLERPKLIPIINDAKKRKEFGDALIANKNNTDLEDIIIKAEAMAQSLHAAKSKEVKPDSETWVPIDGGWQNTPSTTEPALLKKLVIGDALLWHGNQRRQIQLLLDLQSPPPLHRPRPLHHH